MKSVQKTLYIPLFGKALVSRKGIILKDSFAEEIWKSAGFPLGRKSRSKWLAYYMGMRAAVFDQWTESKAGECDVVLHLGCGLDSRAFRVNTQKVQWFDVDFPRVIEERKKFFEQTSSYHMIAADIRNTDFISSLPGGAKAAVIMEGISMYMKPEHICSLLQKLSVHFSSVFVLMDCYSVFAAKVSKYKNPVTEAGVYRTYGIDDPQALASEAQYSFVALHSMTPSTLIDELKGMEKLIFTHLYAGRAAQKLYRLFEFKKL